MQSGTGKKLVIPKLRKAFSLDQKGAVGSSVAGKIKEITENID